MTRVRMDLDMEVADWLEERGMMDADMMHYGRRVGRIETGEGDVPLRYVRDPVEGGHAPRVRVRELDPDVPPVLEESQGPEAPDDRAGGGLRMNRFYALDFIVRMAMEGDLRWLLDRGEGTQCQRHKAQMVLYASKLRRWEDIKEMERICMEARP